MTKTPLSFPDKHADEVVIFNIHRHWSVLFHRMTRWGLLFVLPVVAVVVLMVT